MKFLLSQIDRSLIARLVMAGICLAGTDLLGVAVIFPYLQVLTIDEPQVGAGLVAGAFAWTGAASRTEFLLIVSAALASFFVLKFIVTFVANRVKFGTNALITTRLSDRMLGKLLHADYSYLANNSVSEMTGIVNAETIHATLCLDAWLAIATDALFLVLILATISAIDVRLTVVLVIGMALLSAGLYFAVIRNTSRLGTLQTQIHLRQYRFLFGIVSALKDVKILGLERAIAGEHRELNTRYAAAISSFYVYQTLPRTIIELLVMIGLVGTSVFIVVAGYDLKAATPVIGLLAVAVWRTVPSYGRIVAAYGTYNYYKGSLDTVRRLHHELRGRQVIAHSEPRPFEHRLEIQDLRYSHASKPVLDGVSLSVRRGQSVGIVGMSGSGKTTFLDVLAGLRRADHGRFLLDGRPFDPYATDALRRHLGYVPQNVTLIDDSIAFNIAFEREPDRERLQQAVRVARIEDFIAALPSGFDTQVGENGVRVSGGQKQRIGIARALYRNPDLLIFDEATSSLDNLTERELNAEIAALAGAKTLIIVAHRLSTVERCDEIHVFDHGRVVASGTHAELLRSSPAYVRLNQAHATEAA
jgi:ABC-type bacteriocin/lantibiotic exporter with double-glycine peptidase domain